MSSHLSEFFSAKTLLVTGASGFLGKCLVEKILRSCPHVSTVYVLLRPKGGQTARKRLEALLASQVFSRVPKDQLSKVVAVSGDVTHDELGLSASDRQTVADQVHVVFNCAATIRFDEPLRRALQLNVASAQRVLRLAQRCPRLEALVHVSTAYCTRDKHHVTEEVPREAYSPQRLLDACEWMDDEMLAALAQHLFNGRPSSYHFTKALAEQLLAESDLPLAIVRPSIIVGAWREPFPGWTDNYNGIAGYLVATGKGVLRTLHCEPDFLCDVIPVDLVVNNLIGAARSVASGGSVLVVNSVSGPLNPITWREVRALSTPALLASPSMQVFRAPAVSLHANQWIHFCHLVVEHAIPAFVVDLLFRACGLTPILGQVYQKLNRSMTALQTFTRNEWRFRVDNQKTLCDQLSAQDQQLFPCDVSLVEWKAFFVDFVLGIRQFLLKEEPSSISVAQKKLKA